MQITINKKNNNELLQRQEIFGEVTFEQATPKNTELTEALAGELKKDTNLVIIKSIAGQFGKKKATFTAFVYNNIAARDRIEVMTKHLRKKAEEAKKKTEEKKKKAAEEVKIEEEKKETASEEKPAEEVKIEEEKKETASEEKPAEEEKKETENVAEEKKEEIQAPVSEKNPAEVKEEVKD